MLRLAIATAHAILILTAGWVLVGTDAQAQAAPSAAPTVTFRALDEHERRQGLNDILERVSAERDLRREEHRAYIDLQTAAQTVHQGADGDEILRRSLALSEGLEQLTARFGEGRLRRLAILDRIQAEAGRQAAASSDGLRLLREADRDLRQMLAQQEAQARRLVQMRQQLTRFVQAIPPPPTFTTREGLTMRLVGQGSGAFYVSTAPVTVGLFRRFLSALPEHPDRQAWAGHAASTADEAPLTGVAWYEARRFSEWLSGREGFECRLPRVEEARAIAALSPAQPLAFWSADAWTPPDPAERRDLKRFALSLVTAWDPQANLAPQPGAFGEVPWARYPDLTLYVVTPSQTGVAQRWQRLKAPTP
ncbi:MAG: SUMF1/EgtB/PvdO family nonheme iron enzyme [Lentisphaerae bacterium]|nr:SUMF1/EgtB/PvdO family nonheme iron enzyme [Lentisphaerota bacterium]